MKKKTYGSPQLRTFGDLSRMTLAFGTGVMNDGGIQMTGNDKS